MRRLLGLMLLCCLPACFNSSEAKAQTQTQTPAKIPIYFDCECADPVGAQYATSFRDLLASSPRYSLASEAVENDSTGKPIHYHFSIQVVSLDPTANKLGRESVLSVVLLVGTSTYLTQAAQWCPVAEVNTCSARTLSFLDGFINSK